MVAVDRILTGGIVVTMDRRWNVFTDGAVAIREPDIVAVGPSDQIARRFEAKEVIDCQGTMIIPGLINSHTHVPMSLMRNLADDLRLDVWLLGYMMPVERECVTPEFVRWGTLLSCAEMIRSGITTFCDMYYFEDVVAEATEQAGLRAILGETILKFPSPDATSYDESLAFCRRFIEQWRGHPRIIPAVAPHAPYTCTDEIWHEATALALEFDVPLLTHLSETAHEVEESRQQFNGLSPVAYVERMGVFQARVVAAHCVHVTEDDIALLTTNGVSVIHCPTSNLKLASGVAPVISMRSRGIHMGVGTDGCASNNDQDMFEEIRLAALLPKGTQLDPTALPAREAFALATIEAARALHMDHLIGSLEPGKRADIAVISLDAPHAVPRFNLSDANIYAHLVYAAKASDVVSTWVDGRPLMRDGQLLTIDLLQVLSEAQRLANHINTFLKERESSLLNKLLALGDLEQQETFEVQVKARVQDLSVIERRFLDLGLELVKRSVREQYDTYMLFWHPEHDILRYREDNVVQERQNGRMGQLGPTLEVVPEYTLTLIGPKKEREYESMAILSRSRFTSRAAHSLRFYREYFQPDEIREIVKWRTRYRFLYKGEEFALNLDRITKPEGKGAFVEIKSRTWSAADAVHKAELIGELLQLLQIPRESIVKGEYVNL
ncbi:MAG TPA: amidohydrolase family protein [Caldilineae bacterium]|nr:amidohydrolase family protein [Caldilineae bacterium]